MGVLTDAALDSMALSARIKATAMADVGNLLTANQASIETDTTGFFSFQSPTLARVSGGTHGSYALSLTTASASGLDLYVIGGAGTGNRQWVASPLVTYTACVDLVTTVGRTATVYLLFYNSGGTLLAATAGNTAGSNGLTTTVTDTAPVGTAFADVRLTIGAGSAGDVLTFDRFGFWKGAGGNWAMPGVPITGLRQITPITSATASVTMSPLQDTITVDTTSGAVTVTLPSAALCTGQTKRIVKTGGTNTLTISRAGTDTITPSSGTRTSVAFPAATFGEMMLVSSGSAWHVVSGQASDESVGRRLWKWEQALAASSTTAGVGWQLVYADTGDRNISSLINGTYWTAGTGNDIPMMRRIGNRVDLTGRVTAVAAWSGQNVLTAVIPSGFRNRSSGSDFAREASIALTFSGGPPPVPAPGARVFVNEFNQLIALRLSAVATGNADAAGTILDLSHSWLTNDSWPASLPGSASGTIPTYA